MEGEVPSFVGDVMMYADSLPQVREWIARGVSRAREASASYREERRRGLLRMQAFGHRLRRRQIDDLVAFVAASAGIPAPPEGPAARGFARAESLGCFSCHGPGGRFARPNPGSFRGAVPSWDGGDFAELVRGREEFGEWVLEGRSRRFGRDPLARFFLDRAVLRMPAYEDRLGPEDLEALWAYVRWLRGP